jgi:hypothetical protein
MFTRLYQAVPAVALAALIAGAITILPGASDEVEASPPVAVAKSDRPEFRPVAPACSEQAWPYYEAGCLKDRRAQDGEAKATRIVTADRIYR